MSRTEENYRQEEDALLYSLWFIIISSARLATQFMFARR